MTTWSEGTTKTSTSWSDQSKNSTSFSFQEVTDIDAYLKIDSTFHLLIDSTYKLLIQPQSRLTQWSNQVKN